MFGFPTLPIEVALLVHIYRKSIFLWILLSVWWRDKRRHEHVYFKCCCEIVWAVLGVSYIAPTRLSPSTLVRSVSLCRFSLFQFQQVKYGAVPTLIVLMFLKLTILALSANVQLLLSSTCCQVSLGRPRLLVPGGFQARDSWRCLYLLQTGRSGYIYSAPTHNFGIKLQMPTISFCPICFVSVSNTFPILLFIFVAYQIESYSLNFVAFVFILLSLVISLFSHLFSSSFSSFHFSSTYSYQY